MQFNSSIWMFGMAPLTLFLLGEIDQASAAQLPGGYQESPFTT